MKIRSLSRVRRSGVDNCRPRRGAALVEFAFILPLLFLLILGIMELGRGVMIQQILVNGAREAARTASLPNTTTAEVNQTITDYMNEVNITGYSSSVTPDPESAPANNPITVTISVPYNNVTWLPVGALSWLDGTTMSASTVMRKEP